MPDPNNPTDTNLNPTQVTPPVSDFSGDTYSPPPSDSGAESAAPSFDIPPVITPAPKPKGGRKKVIATILGLLILVGGLGAGVILVRQQQDIREKAATTCAGGVPVGKYVCSNATTCVLCQSSGLYSGPQDRSKCAGQLCGTTAPPPGCLADGKCIAPGGSCCSGKEYFDSTCPVTETRCGTKPTPPPTCVADGKCIAPGDRCCSGKDYFDLTCPVTETRCGTKATPAPTPDICALARRDPLSQGYCDRSAPNTPDCTDKIEGVTCNIRAECGGGTGTCVVINQGGANSECQCQKGATPPPTKTPTPTTPPPGGTPTPPPTKPPRPSPSPGSSPPPPTAQCLDIQAFDTSWNKLSSTDLSSLRPGDKVRFTVAGQASSGNFDKARFIVNSLQRPEVTQKRPGTDEFFDEYTIAGGITRFTINAQIHHETLGWSNPVR